MRIARVLACALWLSAGVAFGQADSLSGPAFSLPPTELLAAGAGWSPKGDPNVLVLLEERRYEFDDRGAATETRRLVYRIVTPEGAKGWSGTGARFEPWYQARPEVRARVVTADGVEHALDPQTLSDDPTRDDLPDLYRDARVYHGPLPAAQAGAVVEEEIVTRDTRPYFPGGSVYRVRLGRGVPVLRTRILITAPAAIPLRYAVHRFPAALRSEEAGRVRVVFEGGPLDAQLGDERNLPGDVVPFPGVSFSTGASWSRVAEEYTRLTEPRVRPDEVRKLVERAVKPGDSREQILAKLLASLHREVRYTGVEFDEANIVPQSPAETLERKYGDCKDKSTLLVTLLRAAGIPAELALLSTGPGEDVDSELPGLGVFNHAIVHVSGSPEYWIDATAESTRLGDLPFEDQGRLALVVRNETSGLVRTPEARPVDNLTVETREFFLAEFGPARIVETTEAHGSAESFYRASFNGPDSEETRKNLEDYVKQTYLAEGLAAYEHDDAANFARPFRIRLEVARGQRGLTDLEAAAVVIRPEGISNRLPAFPESPDEAGEAVRTEDFVFDPFVTEWRYRVHAPPGFRLHALPKNETTELGPALFTAEYALDDGGVLAANLRFDTRKGRYSPGEVRALRSALREHVKSGPTTIGFDHIGSALLAAGKPAEALRAFEARVAEEPKQALARVRIARALLKVGLAEKARAEALEATKLDAKSGPAWTTLGWVLEHDLLGRRFRRGFDLDGALAAYRKAKALDPKDEAVRGSLAILLEEGPDGVRYAPTAHLDQAIAEYRELKALQKGPGELDDNLLYAELYAGRFSELRESAAALPASAARQAFQIAGVAGERGAAAAIEESARVTSDETARSRALLAAGGLLVRVRRYPQAVDLLEAGARESNSAGLLQQIGVLRKAKRHEESLLPGDDPRGVVQRFFVELLTTPRLEERAFTMFSKYATDGEDRGKMLLDLNRGLGGMRQTVEKSELSRDVIADIGLGGIKYSVEGDDALGYRITLQPIGASSQVFYVTREDSTYRILGMADASMAVGRLVLDLVAHDDLPAARQWLERVRDEQHLSGQDDPLGGPLFPRFWSKGQAPDREALRYAAASLVLTTPSAASALAILEEGRRLAQTKSERTRFDLALAAGHAQRKDWAALLPVAERLQAAAPASDAAFVILTGAYRGLARWDDWEKAARARRERLPDDLLAARSLAERAALLGRAVEARAFLASFVENGRAEVGDLNNYAWSALFTAAVPSDAVEAAERANSLTQGKFPAFLHTLACLYAELGRTNEARELLLQAMEAGGLDEPDSNIWYGLGRIAEQYGVKDAAAAAYRRVTKPEDPLMAVSSTHALAQARLRALYGQASGAAPISASREPD